MVNNYVPLRYKYIATFFFLYYLKCGYKVIFSQQQKELIVSSPFSLSFNLEIDDELTMDLALYFVDSKTFQDLFIFCIKSKHSYLAKKYAYRLKGNCNPELMARILGDYGE